MVVQIKEEAWDGSSWTEVADLSVARSYADGAGISNTNAIYAGGYTGTTVATVDEWAAADFQIKSVTTS
jgi:hypothetical protein